jgi:threonine dehydrogenase-like Zn-dependent dehydrogenase
MRATYIYGAGDVRVIDVTGPVIQQPTDAIVRVVRACICGSDLHPYHSMPVTPGGRSVPQYENAPVGFGSLFGCNITLTGGPAPARGYIPALMRGILAGEVNPGRVFDREVTLDQTPQGYQDMDARRALKVLVRP